MNDRIPGLRGRGQTYGFVAGVVVALLVAALAVPFAFGHRDEAAGAGSASVGALPQPSLAGAAGVPTPGAGPAAVGSAAPPAPGAAPVAAGGNPLPGGGPAAAPAAAPGAAPGAASGPAASGTAPASRGGAPARPGSGRLGSTPLTASAPGITPTTVTIGVMLVDFGGASSVGAAVAGYDTNEQKGYYEKYRSHVNATGGIDGRTLVFDYKTVDILSQDSMTQACNQLAAERVFAVTYVLGVYGPPILCVTKEHGMPLIATDGAVESYYQQSNGLLFTTGPATLRTNANMAARLVQAGLLRKDRPIGLLGEDGYLQPEFEAFKRYLESLGLTVTMRLVSSSDTSTAATQMPAVVQAFRAAGVLDVMPLVNSLYASQFVTDAKPNGFDSYYVSDFDYEMAGDSFLTNMPAEFFDHAYSVTATRVGESRIGVAEPAYDRQCREIYDASMSRTSDAYDRALPVCTMVDLFRDGLAKAGPNPTRQDFARVVGNLGSFPNALGGASSFRPGKTDAPDAVHLDRAFGDCKCWKPQEQFVAARFR